MEYKFAKRMAGMQASAVREILKVTQRPEVISFAGGLPAPELFPVEEIGKVCQEVCAAEGHKVLQYATTEGRPSLRAKIADHVIECHDLGHLHTEVTKHRIPGSLWYRVKRLLESPTAAIMTFWMQSTFSLQGVSLKAPSPLIVNTPLFSSHSMPSMVQLSSLSASAPL